MEERKGREHGGAWRAAERFRYRVTLSFSGGAWLNARLKAFEAVKKLGSFRVRDQSGGSYLLDFSSDLPEEDLRERLGKISGRELLFDYSVESHHLPRSA